jgi:hypothetical protein
LNLPVILYYDHLITLDLEIKHIWSKKTKKIAIAFLIMRYVGLVVMTVVYGFQSFFLILNNPIMQVSSSSVFWHYSYLNLFRFLRLIKLAFEPRGERTSQIVSIILKHNIISLQIGCHWLAFFLQIF